MKIRRAVFAPGVSAFYFDDQRAIKNGAGHDGFVYTGAPVTAGFRRVREAGQSVSVLLELDNGAVAAGDCAAVQYSGAGGRDPLFLAEVFIPFLETHLRPRLEGREVASFRELAAEFEALTVAGKRLHTAVRYGLSQALLDARARATNRLACEVLCDEYGLPVCAEPVRIFGQCGDSRYENVDKMILKRVDALPHGLINNIDEKVGRDGGKLREYIRWLRGRIVALRTDDGYRPTLHIDVYGTIGDLFGNDAGKVAAYLASLAADAGGLDLYIEGPVDMGGREAQMEKLAAIRAELRRLGSPVKIVADEWCNTLEDIRLFADAAVCDMVQIKTPDLGGIQETVEAVLYCQQRGMEAYQGGTCNETDVSARACVHAAMASRPRLMLAKPGMGFDEGFTIVHNEMRRIMALLRARKGER
jgi:methylaspartate ammonia-lyase